MKSKNKKTNPNKKKTKNLRGTLIEASQAFYLNRLLTELFPIEPRPTQPAKVIWLSTAKLYRARYGQG
ncbi:MAG TPA: hypothetical protein VE954_29850 [Oligoflexus sp.]|uniref:hypothetical protein n=1 Tax=Oligoflexus sp. TaxID=1971216 RepID=UPI002D573BAB|nr:hypothetical protein [Oligoflexus sp.]HYX37329.1 hypothetical protein [Oligoflexus sp.]